MLKMQPIIAELRNAADTLGVKFFAAEFGHSRQYLERVLNPEPDPEDKKHMPLEYALKIMAASGRHEAFVLMAAELGLTVSALPVPDKATSREECADDVRCLAEMQVSMAEGAPPSVVQTLAGRACDDIQQTAVKYTEEWMQGAKQ